MKIFGLWEELERLIFRSNSRKVTILPNSQTTGDSVIQIPNMAGTTQEVILSSQPQNISGKTLIAPTINAPAIGGATTFSLDDTDSAFNLTLQSTSTLTAGRTITLDAEDGNRTLTLGGNLNLAGDLTKAGTHATTLTTTGVTNVTLPTTGTLSTLAGIETLTSKTLNGATLNAPAIGGATTFSLDDSDSAFNLAIQSTSTLTAPGRVLTVDVEDGSRTLTLAGNLTKAASHDLTLTTTGSTNVTLPSSGTLSTLAGSESLSNKTVVNGVLSGTTTTSNSGIVRFTDSDGSNYTGLKADATTTASLDYTLPAAGPASNGQVLSSTTAGAMSWVSPLVNPMDSAGDMIYGGAGGTATKLDSGTANQYLQANGAAAPTWVSVLAPSGGTAAAPSYSFLADTSTGMYSDAATNIKFATSGVNRATISTSAFTSTLPHISPAGTVGAPSYSFTGDTSLGIYSSGVSNLDFATAGVNRLNINTTSINPTLPYYNAAGSAGAPSYTFAGDTSTGIYSSGATTLDFATAGVNRLSISTSAISSSLPVNPSTDNTIDLGTTALRWRSVHVGPGSYVLHGDATNTKKLTMQYTGSTAEFVGDASTGFSWQPGTAESLTLSAAGVLAVGAAGGTSVHGVNGSWNFNTTGTTPTEGIHRSAAGTVSLAAGGTDRMSVTSTALSTTVAHSNISGSAGDPSYSFTSDLDTGMYHAGSSTLGFSTANTARMTLNATEAMYSVPVRTADGTNTAPAHSFTNDTSTGMYISAATVLRFSAGGNIRLTIDEPNSKIITTSRIESIAGTASAVGYGFTNDASTGLYSSGAGTLNVAAGGGPRLTINSTNITGTLPTVLSGVPNATAGMLNIKPDSGQAGYITFSEGATNRWAQGFDSGSNNFSFRQGTATGTLMGSIGLAGNWTFGPNPLSGSGVVATKNSTATASSTDRVYDAQFTVDTDCTGGYFYTCLNSAGTTIGRIEAASNTTTTFTGSSDARLKQNPTEFDGLAIIAAMQPREFEWISNPGVRNKGFYAQELYEVLPEVVSVGSDDLVSNGDLRNPWGIDYGRLTPVLVRAVQQLQEQLAAALVRIDNFEE